MSLSDDLGMEYQCWSPSTTDRKEWWVAQKKGKYSILQPLGGCGLFKGGMLHQPQHHSLAQLRSRLTDLEKESLCIYHMSKIGQDIFFQRDLPSLVGEQNRSGISFAALIAHHYSHDTWVTLKAIVVPCKPLFYPYWFCLDVKMLPFSSLCLCCTRQRNPDLCLVFLYRPVLLLDLLDLLLMLFHVWCTAL